MIKFTLRQLEYLVESVDQGSIASAATRLNVSQPSISSALSKLEEQLDVQLLVRHYSQGVSPTNSGTTLVEAARNLIREANEFQQLAAVGQSEVAGKIRVGSFGTLAPSILPALVREMATKFPKVRIQLSEANQDHLVNELQKGRLDAALMYDIDLPRELTTVRLSERHPYVALPSDHELARKENISLRDLSKFPMILLDVAPSRRYFLGLFEQANLKPNIAHSSPSLELVRAMVGHGMGYSILVTRPSGDITQDGKPLVIRALADRVPPSSIVLASLKTVRKTKTQQCLEDVAVRVCSNS